MNKITRTLNRIKDDNNLTKRQKYIVSATVEHIEHIEKQCCEDCKHYSHGLQPDGIGWSECEYFFDCKVVHSNNFEKRL